MKLFLFVIGVMIAFSNSDYQISEFSQNVLIEITKDSRIASSITLSIVPQTIDEVILSGGSLPINITSHDPHSPNRASKTQYATIIVWCCDCNYRVHKVYGAAIDEQLDLLSEHQVSSELF